MVEINNGYNELNENYLFPRVAKVRNEFEKKSGKKVMRLDIGDAKIPLGPTVSKAMAIAAERLQYTKGFSNEEINNDEIKKILNQAGYDKFNGYGDEQGCTLLRQTLADKYKLRNVNIEPSEIFVSDGAKSDSANIQSIFAQNSRIAITDPAYPVYVDTNVIAGRGGIWNDQSKNYTGLIYLPCKKENEFKPTVNDLNKLDKRIKADLIYLCSPNNPTSAVMTKEDLKEFVDYAIDKKAVIIFDAAYSAFIQDENLPRSIYEIENAKKCAIELQSFSKSAGFTGVRLGWTVVPNELQTESTLRYDNNGKVKNSLNAIWNGRQTRFFNGASNIVQAGGLSALLTEGGKAECRSMVETYMGNAKIIREGLEKKGYEVNGGINGPYLWFNTGMDSWAFLNKLLEETSVSCTPGVGFGSCGDGYARLSAFALREDVEKAMDSITKNLRR